MIMNATTKYKRVTITMTKLTNDKNNKNDNMMTTMMIIPRRLPILHLQQLLLLPQPPLQLCDDIDDNYLED